MSDRFYFIANNLALDFVNTLIVDEREEPLELLRSANDLMEWASVAGLDTRKAGRTSGGQDQDLFQRAICLRGELKRMAKAVSEGKRVPTSAIKAINDELSRAHGCFELSATPSGYSTAFRKDAESSPDLLMPIAESAARLLSEGDLNLVRKCQRSACVLYFYDNSKRHGRRWCSMSACGNRAKAAAFYDRTRGK